MKLKLILTLSIFFIAGSLSAQTAGFEIGAEDGFYNGKEMSRFLDSDGYVESTNEQRITDNHTKMLQGKERSKNTYLDVFFKFPMNNLWLTAGGKIRKSKSERTEETFTPIVPEMNYEHSFLSPVMDMTTKYAHHEINDDSYYVGIESGDSAGITLKTGTRQYEDTVSYSWTTMVYGPFASAPNGPNFLEAETSGYGLYGNAKGAFYSAGFFSDIYEDYVRFNYEYISSPALRGNGSSGIMQDWMWFAADQGEVISWLNGTTLAYTQFKVSSYSHSLNFEFFPYALVSVKIGATSERLNKSYPGYSTFGLMSMMYIKGANPEFDFDFQMIEDNPEFISDYMIYAAKKTSYSNRAYIAVNAKVDFDE